MGRKLAPINDGNDTRTPRRIRGHAGRLRRATHGSFPSSPALVGPSAGAMSLRTPPSSHAQGRLSERSGVPRVAERPNPLSYLRRLCLRVASAAVESGLCMSSGALPGPDLLRVIPRVS